MVFLPLVFLSFYLSIEGKARERGGIERRILTGERLVFIELEREGELESPVTHSLFSAQSQIL
jgi:hypothetical protein